MLALFVGACVNFANPDQNKTSFDGIGAALIFGLGGLGIGVVLMAWARCALPKFFMRRRETAGPVLTEPRG